MNIVNNDDKELPSEKKAQRFDELLEIAEVRPQEGTKGAPLEEKAIPSTKAMPPSKEMAEVKPKIKRKPKREPQPESQSPIMEAAKKWEDKWVDVDGEKVLFVPSGFEIMTKDGWRPVMMRADKITK